MDNTRPGNLEMKREIKSTGLIKMIGFSLIMSIICMVIASVIIFVFTGILVELTGAPGVSDYGAVAQLSGAITGWICGVALSIAFYNRESRDDI